VPEDGHVGLGANVGPTGFQGGALGDGRAGIVGTWSTCPTTSTVLDRQFARYSVSASTPVRRARP
jgi:hypothetical protein